MKGVQIGLINKSKKLKGLQIGLWNVNQKRKLPLINWNFKITILITENKKYECLRILRSNRRTNERVY
jgi:hypothetical protein